MPTKRRLRACEIFDACLRIIFSAVYFAPRAEPGIRTGLLHGKRLLADQGSFRKDIDLVGSCRQIFLYVPVDGDGLFFARVFDVFFDGISEVFVFVGERSRIFGQYFAVGFGQLNINGSLSRLGGDVLDDGKADGDAFHPAHSLDRKSVG